MASIDERPKKLEEVIWEFSLSVESLTVLDWLITNRMAYELWTLLSRTARIWDDHSERVEDCIYSMCVDKVVGTVLVRDKTVLKENQQYRITYFILSINRRVSYLGRQSLLGQI